MLHKLSKRQWALLAIVYALLIAVWTSDITGAPIRGDATATLIPAVNLRHHGVYSLDTSEPRIPTMYREPVPVLVTAAMVAGVDAALGEAELAAYYSGDRALLLKLQNLFWLTLLCGAAFVATFYFTSSFALALGMGVLSYLIFQYPALRFSGVDSLHSDIAGTAFLMLASCCYAIGISQRRKAAFVAAGLLFGLLALTKAAALYVFAGVLIALPALVLVRRRSADLPSTLAHAGVMLLAFAVVVAPWMARNWVQLGVLSIAERGGIALYHRALFNEVNATEYTGLFYIWAPSPIRAAVGRALGFSRSDLERGGALYRLNGRMFAPGNLAAERAGRPQDATSIMVEGRAERVKARMAFQAAGLGQRAHAAADAFLRERAIRMMIDNPGGMLAVTLAALWRGAPLLLPLFAWVIFDSWRKGRDDLLGFCVPALGVVMFYALFTHFEPRYGAAMTPIAFVAFASVLMNSWLAARGSSWRRGARRSDHQNFHHDLRSSPTSSTLA